MLLTCCVFVLLSSCIAAKTSVSLDGISEVTCDENETACGSSCCPHPNAVCCNETQSCCQQGNVCLGSIPYCLGLKRGDGNPSLYSEKSTALRETACPSGTTTCFGGCCPLPHAVCCPDRMTCCPAGYFCGPIGSKVCEKGIDVASRFLKTVLTKIASVPSTDTSNNFLSRKRYYVPTAGASCCYVWFLSWTCCGVYEVCTLVGCL